jgi:hypothetical protein
MRMWTTLKRLCVIVSLDILLQLYQVYILPLIDYCNYTWIPTESQEKKFEGIQKHVTTFICFKSGSHKMSRKTIKT